jgi:hypothetical protein
MALWPEQGGRSRADPTVVDERCEVATTDVNDEVAAADVNDVDNVGAERPSAAPKPSAPP